MRKQFSGGPVPPEILADVQKCVSVAHSLKGEADTYTKSFDLPSGGVCHVQILGDRVNADVELPSFEKGKGKRKLQLTSTLSPLGFVMDDDSLLSEAIIAPAERETPLSPDVDTVHYSSETPEGVSFPVGWSLTQYEEGPKAGLIDWRDTEDKINPFILSWEGTSRYGDFEIVNGRAGSKRWYLNGYAGPEAPNVVIGAGYRKDQGIALFITKRETVETGQAALNDIFYNVECHAIRCGIANNALYYETIDEYDPTPNWLLLASVVVQHDWFAPDYKEDAYWDALHHWVFDKTATVAATIHVSDPEIGDGYWGSLYTYVIIDNSLVVSAGSEYIDANVSPVESFDGNCKVSTDGSGGVFGLADTSGTLHNEINVSQLIALDYNEDNQVVLGFYNREYFRTKQIISTYVQDPNSEHYKLLKSVAFSVNCSDKASIRMFVNGENQPRWDVRFINIGGSYNTFHDNITHGTSTPPVVSDVVIAESSFIGQLLDFDLRTQSVLTISCAVGEENVVGDYNKVYSHNNPDINVINWKSQRYGAISYVLGKAINGLYLYNYLDYAEEAEDMETRVFFDEYQINDNIYGCVGNFLDIPSALPLGAVQSTYSEMFVAKYETADLGLSGSYSEDYWPYGGVFVRRYVANYRRLYQFQVTNMYVPYLAIRDKMPLRRVAFTDHAAYAAVAWSPTYVNGYEHPVFDPSVATPWYDDDQLGGFELISCIMGDRSFNNRCGGIVGQDVMNYNLVLKGIGICGVGTVTDEEEQYEH